MEYSNWMTCLLRDCVQRCHSSASRSGCHPRNTIVIAASKHSHEILFLAGTVESPVQLVDYAKALINQSAPSRLARCLGLSETPFPLDPPRFCQKTLRISPASLGSDPVSDDADPCFAHLCRCHKAHVRKTRKVRGNVMVGKYQK
jgi:hypothetical protein